MRRLEWIDQAKGIAILMVVAVHLSQALSLPSALKMAAAFGALGVQLFFMMSAYCVCLTWDSSRFDRWYWWRKYKRLAGWYLVGIVVYFCYWQLKGVPETSAAYTVGNVLANVLLVNGFFPAAQNAIVPGGWSISCIAMFVFAYPLLMKLSGNCLAAALIAASVVGSLLSLVGYKILGWSRFYAYCVPINQIAPFAVGIFLWHKRDWLLRHIAPGAACVLSLSFSVVTVAAVMLDRENAIFYRQTLISFAFLFGLLLLNGRGGGRLLGWLGRHSYEIFIFHFLLIWVVFK